MPATSDADPQCSNKDDVIKRRVCNTRILPEQPAQESDYKAHNQIADALYETICRDDESVSIALVGEFGSGKSTIIELLKQKAKGGKGCEEDCKGNVLVFEYDAWTHSGDSIRRSFIQELIEELRSEHVEGRIEVGLNEKHPVSLRDYFKELLFSWKSAHANESLWQDQYERIVRRRQKTKQTSQTVLGLQGALLALATGLLTFGITLLGKPDTTFPDLLPLLGDQTTGYAGFIASGVAVGIFGLMAYIGFLQWASGNEGSGIYKNEVSSKSTASTDRQSPSTFDFRSAFEHVIRDVLVANEGLNLVIVVDNIDRLSPDEVRRDWKMLQSFFDVHSSNQNSEEEWAERLWTIVAFDEGQLQNVWGSNGSTNSARFIEKTFQVKQVVPLPVYSKWKEQLRTFLGKAFSDTISAHSNSLPTGNNGAITDDSINKVEEIIDFYCPEPNRSINKKVRSSKAAERHEATY